MAKSETSYISTAGNVSSPTIRNKSKRNQLGCMCHEGLQISTVFKLGGNMGSAPKSTISRCL